MGCAGGVGVWLGALALAGWHFVVLVALQLVSYSSSYMVGHGPMTNLTPTAHSRVRARARLPLTAREMAKYVIRRSTVSRMYNAHVHAHVKTCKVHVHVTCTCEHVTCACTCCTVVHV
jgi:hypothetical protein